MAEPGVWSTYFYPLFLTVGYILAIVVPLMLVLAFITYFERKVWAAIQLRKGPNVVGPFGLLQPVADGIKCLFKETIVPPAPTARSSCWRRWSPSASASSAGR